MCGFLLCVYVCVWLLHRFLAGRSPRLLPSAPRDQGEELRAGIGRNFFKNNTVFYESGNQSN